MRKFLFLLTAGVLVTLAVKSTRAQACSCEFAWEEAVSAVWQGQSLDQTQIDDLLCPELRYLRNITYARHGFTFGDNWVKVQFQDDVRYQSDAYVDSTTVGSMLTSADKTNVDLVRGTEEAMQCTAWWERNGDDIVGWNFGPVQEPEAPTYLWVEQISLPVIGGQSDQTVPIVSTQADPAFVATTIFDNEPVDEAWLVPFTCEDLGFVEQALNARAGQTSQDKLTQLRFNRQQREKGCKSRPPPASHEE